MFKNKIALVTGGGTGVGKAVCTKLAASGATVVLNYAHSSTEAQETAECIRSLGGKITLLKADVSSDCEVTRMFEKVKEEYGTLHYLVNNASITKQIELQNLNAVTDDIWEKLFSVNLLGMFYCARAAAAIMEKRSGCSIINMGSSAGITGSGSSLPYAVSKAAVHGLTKSLAHALAPDIRVNCIAPAAIATRWWAGEEEKMYRLSGHLPLQRISTPEDIAELVCNILIQPSMTGQIISPNNGMII